MAMSLSALLHILDAVLSFVTQQKKAKEKNPDSVFIFESNLHQDDFVSSI
jgi:hypothetical protein